MDNSFNPFANAWDDDPSTASHQQESGNGSSSRGEQNGSTPSWSEPSIDLHTSEAALPSWEPASNSHLQPDNDDADAGWGAPISSRISDIDGDALSGQNGDASSERPASPARDTGWALSNVSPTPTPSGAGQGDAGQDEDYVAGTHSPRRRSQERAEQDEDEFGAFGSTDLDYKLPSASAGDADTRDGRGDDDDNGGEWGATALPPSKWEESLNAKPTWHTPDKETGWAGEAEMDFTPSSAREEEEDDPNEDEDGETQAYNDRASHGRPESTSTKHARSGSSAMASPSAHSATFGRTEDELAEIRRLQEEYGIQIRNLDEEHVSAPTSPSTSTSGKATESTAAKTGATGGSRWSLFSRKAADLADQAKKGTESVATAAVAGVEGLSANKPTSGMSSITSAISAEEKEQERARSAEEARAKKAEADAAAANGEQGKPTGSRWFRFGAAGTAVRKASETTSSTASSSAQQAANDPAISEDFGQLENFDSRRAASQSDEFGLGVMNNDGGGDGKRAWSLWNRGTALAPGTGLGGSDRGRHAALGKGAAPTAAGRNGEDDDEFEGLDEAFTAPVMEAQPASSSLSNFGAGSARGPASSTQSRTRQLGDSMSALSMAGAASGIRSTSTFDTFDPLDPLAEYTKAENRQYSDGPRRQTGSQQAAYSDYAFSTDPAAASSVATRGARSTSVSSFPKIAPLPLPGTISPAGTPLRMRTVSPQPGGTGLPPRSVSPRISLAGPLGPTRAPTASPSGVPFSTSPFVGPTSEKASRIPSPRMLPPQGQAQTQVLRPLARSTSATGSTVAPPLLPPPPSFPGAKRNVSPAATPSLLDDFGDFTTHSSTSSVTGGPAPVATVSPATPFGLPLASSAVPAVPASTKHALADDEDDFGDFAAFSSAATKPAKAGGPMQLARPPTSGANAAIPKGMEAELGIPRSGTPLSKNDLSFFDSL